MNEHLSATMLDSLADGELASDVLAMVSEHLAGCPECTSRALAQSLLKSAAAKAGQRYPVSAEFQKRMGGVLAAERSRPSSGAARGGVGSRSWLRWGSVAALVLVCASLFVVRWDARLSSETGGLVTEICDQHIATLAANAPPEVISSDRHTVKPWFQGKIPFSFNLPQTLPDDTTLDGANLTYLRNKPTAQLLFSVGKHRVSVFVQQSAGSAPLAGALADHAGFHVAGFRTDDLEVVAVSDVEPARLADLVGRIEQAQTGSQGRAR